MAVPGPGWRRLIPCAVSTGIKMQCGLSFRCRLTTRHGKPFQALHLFLTSLRTTPKALLQLVRDRWSIEGWHWIRDTQLHEDCHRFRGKGAGAMATLRTAAMNLLRLAGCRSIRAGMQAVMHDITALLAMATRQPSPNPW